MNEAQYLFSLENRGIKLGLQRTIQLLAHCGDPHKKIKVIQIIGTNGKGSSSAILNQLLKSSYKVGLYTSPHLCFFQERIRVDGTPISIKEVQRFLKKYKNIIEKLEASFFEVMTVMSAWFFVNKKVDYAIMETGLGGKFDSVSACEPDLYGITSISMDHMHILGSDLKAITQEKIGGIPSGSTIFSVLQKKIVKSEIQKYCINNNCELKAVNTNNKLQLSLEGAHQKENASLAISIFKHINPSYKRQDIEKSLLLIKWFGRNQTIEERPKIIFDVAHNESGILSFINNMKLEKTRYRKKYLLLSIQKNKKLDNIANHINSTFDEIIYSTTNKTKSMEFSQIKSFFPQLIYIKDPSKSIKYILAKAQEKDFIGIIGTHYWAPAVNRVFNISFDNL